jgi:peptide/nickel transport system ATP-binding protein
VHRGWHSRRGAADHISGCPFHPRCPLAVDICVADEPALSNHDGTLVACHRAGDPDALGLPAVPRPTDETPQHRPALDITGVTRDFGDRHRQIRALTTSISASTRGEIDGLIGESGSRKSTLARLALGLLQPTSGRVSIDGTDLATLSRAALLALGRSEHEHCEACASAVLTSIYERSRCRCPAATVRGSPPSARVQSDGPGRR